MSSTPNPLSEISPSPSPSSATAPALVLSNSGKRIDQAGRKKYVKQVTGRHNDTELHLAAQRGDLAAVKQILGDIDSQIMGTFSGDDVNTEIAEVLASVVNEENELGETALFTAAEKGHLDVVKELLKHSNKESVSKKNRSGFDPLHVAASQGHHGIRIYTIIYKFSSNEQYSQFFFLVHHEPILVCVMIVRIFLILILLIALVLVVLGIGDIFKYTI